MNINHKIYIGLALLLLVVIFIVQNAVVVEIRWLFWTLTMSRSLMIFFVLAIGIAIGWILGSHFGQKPITSNEHS
ncbi:MAG: LapA family protein [Gammaproteobacteria bacterium]|nr:LapA family protein [Gammaproteobacteria bacterium]